VCAEILGHDQAPSEEKSMDPIWAVSASDRRPIASISCLILSRGLALDARRSDLLSMQETLNTLSALALRHVEGRVTYTALPRVAISTGTAATKPVPVLYEPMLCLVLQGAKEVLIGDRRLRYDPATMFIATLELPVSGCVIEASPGQPYIGVTLALDSETLAGLLPELPGTARTAEAPAAGFAVSAVTPELLEPWQRLLRLLDSPADIPVLAPLAEREILYRLLQGPQGGVLRQIARGDGRLSRIRRVLAWIRAHYDQPLRIETLTELAGMSTAAFHRHFKAATAMSPLQYQKSLRLQQARRLLIADPDAARAGYAVGYESASQFSREYARLFGTPPGRDAARLRGEGAALAEAGD
jgi:AraC-like DNA-binding protein